MISGAGPEVRKAAEPQEPVDLKTPEKLDVAMQLIAAAENGSLDWRCQYRYIEFDVEAVGDDANRGYTGGIVGFTSKTGDMLEVVQEFKKLRGEPGKEKEKPAKLIDYIPQLTRLASPGAKQTKLGEDFLAAWMKADSDFREDFREAQDRVRDEHYLTLAIKQAKADGLSLLGQFIYFDALVMHGYRDDDPKKVSFTKIRDEALKANEVPSKRGTETNFLQSFLNARVSFMEKEEDHKCNIDRVKTMQQCFLNKKNWELKPPLKFRVNGQDFEIKKTSH